MQIPRSGHGDGLQILQHSFAGPQICRQFQQVWPGMAIAVRDGMTSKQLRDRTMQLALRVHRLAKPLLQSLETRHVAMQLFRSSTSVAANYRAVCLGRSRKDFVAKLATVREEADETVFWLTFIEQARLGTPGTTPEIATLRDESGQLARIFAASHRTARRKLAEKRRARRTAVTTVGPPPKG